MKKQMIFILLAAVLILGCTSASGPAGPGLTIREFSFSPTSLTGAQKTSLSLVVQNTGSMDVKDAYAKIFGFGKESKLWNVATPCEGCGKDDKTNTEVKIPLLRAQSSFAGNVGEQKKFVWLLQNNDNIPKDMARSYTANARLCYPYSTTALGRVELMSENEWMSKNSPQHEILVSQTSAPVRITVLSKQPIISSGQLSLDLLIENVGGGTVASDGYCKYNFGGSNVVFSDKDKITEAEFRAFEKAYFDTNWAGTPKYNSGTKEDKSSFYELRDVNDKKDKTILLLDASEARATANIWYDCDIKTCRLDTTKSLTFSVKDNKIYDDSASSRLNRLNLEISGLTKDKCTTSVGTSNSIFLEKGKSVKVSADCGIGSESAPVSAADLKIEMGYNYYVDAKATVGVKGPNEAIPVIEACGKLRWDASCGADANVCNLDPCKKDEKIFEIMDEKVKGSGTYEKTGINVKHPQKKLYYGGVEKKTLKEGENFVAYKRCDQTMERVFINLHETGDCSTKAEVTYGLALKA